LKIPNILENISKVLLQYGAKTIIVGGSVRDHFLKLPIKDYDIEVYGLESLDILEKILAKFGSVNFVGRSFGVLKFKYKGEEYDFSFPRVEKKISKGHKGFNITVDGNMDFKKASSRRDFTINAMGYDIEKKRFLDPYKGIEDIKQRVVRVINSNTFIDDPLRVYRAIQFCARFNYRLSTKSIKLCKKMVKNGMLDELPKERVYIEFKKLLLKAQKPSIGFSLMRELGVLRYYPELEAIIGVPQNKRWHPEGDVWTHTLLAVDKMTNMRSGDKRRDIKLMFATLCHDFGKVTHTQIEGDRISARGHEKAGVAPTKSFLKRLTDEERIINGVALLVQYHLIPTQYYTNRVNDRVIRKLATKIDIEELVTVARADFLGRTTEESLSGVYEAGNWLLTKAKKLKVERKPPKPIFSGRDLITLGAEPSPKFKTILNDIYNAQLDGKVSNYNEAVLFVKNHYSSIIN